MHATAQILITKTTDNNVQAEWGGENPDKATLLGMLELAKALILSHKEQPVSPILLARGALPPNGR